jgi:hypothetical protein
MPTGTSNNRTVVNVSDRPIAGAIRGSAGRPLSELGHVERTEVVREALERGDSTQGSKLP